MRRGRLIKTLTTAAIFIILEALAMTMIARGSLAHRDRILGAFSHLNEAIWNQTQRISHFFDFRRENERLAAENLALRNALAAREAVAAVDPAAAPASPRDGRYSYTLAHVIHNSTGSQRNYLVLDCGEADGIRPGSGVVTADGVVGVVSQVRQHYCRVESFLNTSQRVSARIVPCGAFGLLRWSGRSPHKAILTEIPMHTQVAEGDTVLTSGYSAIYPPDIPIGVVRNISSDGVSLEMKVDLFQNFNTLYHVYVVNDREAQTMEEFSHAH